MLGGEGRWKRGMTEEIMKGHMETSRPDEYVHCLDFGDSFTGMNMPNIIKLYILNKCSFLDINDTTIKLL